MVFTRLDTTMPRYWLNDHRIKHRYCLMKISFRTVRQTPMTHREAPAPNWWNAHTATRSLRQTRFYYTCQPCVWPETIGSSSSWVFVKALWPKDCWCLKVKDISWTTQEAQVKAGNALIFRTACPGELSCCVTVVSLFSVSLFPYIQHIILPTCQGAWPKRSEASFRIRFINQ